MATLAELYPAFHLKHDAEKDAIARYAALGKAIGPGAVANLKLLARLAAKGVANTLGPRVSQARRDEVTELVTDFVRFGTKAVLLTGAQRRYRSTAWCSSRSGRRGRRCPARRTTAKSS
jgi:hypothetical protein